MNPKNNESKDNNIRIPATNGKCNPVVTCYKCKQGKMRLIRPSSDSIQLFQ